MDAWADRIQMPKPVQAAIPAADVLGKLKLAAHLEYDGAGLAADDQAPVGMERLATHLSNLTLESRRTLLPDRFEMMDRQLAFTLRCLTTTNTIEEAFKCIAEVGAICSPGLAKVRIAEAEGRVALYCEPFSEDLDKLFVHDLRSAALGLAALDWVSGGKLTGMKAEFLYAPIDTSEIAKIFPYEVVTGRPATRLSIRSEDLRKPVIRTPNDVGQFLGRASLIAVCGNNYRKRAFDEVQGLVERGLHLHNQVPSLEHICDVLATSPATLHRRLRAEGYSFRDVREQTLNSVAKQLLSETSASIASIAERLGYSDERPFRRSFMRWNGCSPVAYRALQQGRKSGRDLGGVLAGAQASI